MAKWTTMALALAVPLTAVAIARQLKRETPLHRFQRQTRKQMRQLEARIENAIPSWQTVRQAL